MKEVRSVFQMMKAAIVRQDDPDAKWEREAFTVFERWQHTFGRRYRERESLTRKLEKAMREGNAAGVLRCAKRLSDVLRELGLLETLGNAPSIREAVVQKFVFSSAIMRDSFQFCIETPEEGMHFVVGIEMDGLLLGTHIVPFPYEYRSLAGAAGDHRATHRVCIEAHESGHSIIALLHSHPGCGLHANHPSGIDRKTQTLWEHGKKMVGGIWSRDGYLRWYSSDLAFEVRIVGNHLKEVGENVWKAEDEKNMAM